MKFLHILLVLLLFPGSSHCQQKMIVSLAPNITEILFAIGAGDNVIGVTDYCTYPPEARRLPKVGGLLNLNYELLLTMKPDIIIMPPAFAKEERKMRSFGLTGFTIKKESVAEIIGSIRLIGEKTGYKIRAGLLADSLANELDSLRKQSSVLPVKKVLFIIGKSPGSLKGMTAAGPGTYLDELLTIAGGKNILQKSPVAFPVVSKDYVVSQDPDIIFDASAVMGYSDTDREKELKLWKLMPRLKAVENNAIVYLSEDYLLIPGPRILQTTKLIFRYLHGKAGE